MKECKRIGIDCSKISACEIIKLIHANPKTELYKVPVSLNAAINLLGLKPKIYITKKDFTNCENELVFRRFFIAS